MDKQTVVGRFIPWNMQYKIKIINYYYTQQHGQIQAYW